MPVGTEIYKVRKNIENETETLKRIGVLKEDGEEILIARGGKGGIGNGKKKTL